MRAAIYSAYHLFAPLIASDSFHPIQVGRAGAGQILPDMMGDDRGEHISERNGAWCELTALYWMWKNDQDADLLGLMHYRRLADLTDRAPSGPVEAHPGALDLAEWCAEAEDWLAREGDQWDIVLPRLHQMGRTVEENYHAGHHAQDFDLLRQVIRRDYPHYSESFEAVARGRAVRLGNIALMARPIFERYCAWLFDILFQVEAADLSRDHYTPYQARYIGFLAERLLTVFTHHEITTNPDLRLKEVSILNLSQPFVTPLIAKGTVLEPDHVHIAMASDRSYLPHAAAMLRSLVDFADLSRPLTVYFLHSGIGTRGLGQLAEVVGEHPRARLMPVHVGQGLEGGYRSASRAPSNATYNRFLLFDLLPGLDRLLYLDADIILRRDVCELYDADMGQAQLAAVPDWIMTRTLTGKTPTIDPDVPDLGGYHRERLGMSDAQIARYFNAGVLLFNFAAMGDLKALGDRLIQEALEGRYLFRDQDILNKHFKDHLYVLDGRWNVFNSDPASYGRVPGENFAKAMAARQDPWLIHYADRDYKPWKGTLVPLAQHYWQALIRTPFYGEVLGDLQRPLRTVARKTGLIVRLGKLLAEHVPVLKAPLLRLYTWLKAL
jgi:lipopolysaccharide biosynthesis glycosyltransferase